MNVDRRSISRLAWALLASLLLHLALVGELVQLRWPPVTSPVSLSPPLELYFSPASSAKAHPAPVEQPKQVVAPQALPPEPEPEASIPEAPPAVDNLLVAALPAATPEPSAPAPVEAAPPAPPLALAPDTRVSRLAQSGALSYQFYWGESRWLAGMAIQRWTIEGARYTLSSSIATTGLFGLLRPLHVVETAKGIISGDKLRPMQFTTQVNDDMRIVAVFNWDKGYFRWYDRSGKGTQALPANSYDKISFLFQLYLDREIDGLASAHISLGRSLEPSSIENLGIEEVVIAGQAYLATHLRRPESAADFGTIDIWLSTAHGIPVKMSYANSAGDYFEQLIAADSLPGATLPINLE